MFQVTNPTLSELNIFRSRYDNQSYQRNEDRVERSLSFGFVRSLIRPSGEMLGYIAWARVVRESLFLMSHSNGLPHYKHEWNEGYCILITDISLSGLEPIHEFRFVRQFANENRIVSYIKKGQPRVWLRAGKYHKRLYLRSA